MFFFSETDTVVCRCTCVTEKINARWKVGEQEGGKDKGNHKIALMDRGNSEPKGQFSQMRSLTSTNHR